MLLRWSEFGWSSSLWTARQRILRAVDNSGAHCRLCCTRAGSYTAQSLRAGPTQKARETKTFVMFITATSLIISPRPKRLGLLPRPDVSVKTFQTEKPTGSAALLPVNPVPCSQEKRRDAECKSENSIAPKALTSPDPTFPGDLCLLMCAF